MAPQSKIKNRKSVHAPGSSLLGSILKSLTVVSLALIVTSSPEVASRSPPLHGLLPDDDLLGAGRDVLDLEIALVVGHREIGIVEHHPPRPHPGMNIADDLAGRPLGAGGVNVQRSARRRSSG